MSMNTYPLTEPAALIITPELAAIINSTGWCPGDHRPDPSTLTQTEMITEYGDVSEALDNLELRNIEGVCHCSEFEGTAEHLIYDDKKPEHENIYFQDYFLCYIAPDRGADLFKAAYRDMDELVNEFRQKLTEQEIDLRGFPLETCICALSGTYFC